MSKFTFLRTSIIGFPTKIAFIFKYLLYVFVLIGFIAPEAIGQCDQAVVSVNYGFNDPLQYPCERPTTIHLNPYATGSDYIVVVTFPTTFQLVDYSSEFTHVTTTGVKTDPYTPSGDGSIDLWLTGTISPGETPSIQVLIIYFPGGGGCEGFEFQIGDFHHVVTGGQSLNVSTLIANQDIDPYPGSNDTHQSIYIDGTMVVDTDYSFGTKKPSGQYENYYRSSEICLGPDARILVQSPNRLVLDETIIYGCQEIWEAIEVEPGASLVIYGADIRDGRYAVQLDQLSKMFVVNTDFIDNWYGIHMIDPLSAFEPKINTPFYVFGSRFFGENDNLIGSTLSPSIGIYTVGLNLGIIHGISSGGMDIPVQFENLSSGLWTSNSNISNYHSWYRDINYTGFFAGRTGNVEIWDNISANSSGNSFVNCFEAIRVQDVNLDVHDVTIRNGTTGVKMLGDLPGYTYKFKENYISSTRQAFHLISNVTTGGYILDHLNGGSKIIKINGSNPYAIGLNFNGLGKTRWRVENNLIQLESGTNNGIGSFGMQAALIRGNSILSSAAGKAIHLEGAFGNQVSCNQILSSQGDGIFVNASPSSSISCNPLINVQGTALQIHDKCDYSLIFRNELHGIYSDLTYGLDQQMNFSITGDQPDLTAEPTVDLHGNRFLGLSQSGFGATHYGSPNEVLLSQYFTNSALDPAFKPVAVSALAPWFFELPNQNASCLPTICPGIREAQYPFRDLLDAVTEDSITSGIYTIPIQWSARRLAYRYLKSKPALQPLYNSFLTYEQNTSVGLLDYFSDQLSNVQQISYADSLQLVFLQDTAKSLAHEISELPILISVHPYKIDTLALNTLQILSDQLQTTFASIDSIQEAYSLILIDALPGLRSILSQVSTTTLWETNEVILNTLILDKIEMRQSEWTSTQKDSLLAIAMQCPYSGGEAVYRARTAITDLGLAYNDSDLCFPAQPRNDALTQIQSRIKATPNPTSGLIALSGLKDGSSYDLRLMDVTGRILESWSGIASSTELDLSIRTNGLYFLVIDSPSGRETIRLIKND